MHDHATHADHEHDPNGGCCGPSRRNFLKNTALVTGGMLFTGTFMSRALQAQATGPMVGQRIDTHFHFYPPELGDALGGGQASRWSPKIALDQMDKNGVLSSICSLSSIPEDWFRKDKEWLRKTVRTVNDYGAGMVRNQPKRFGLFAFLSMLDVEGSLKEIEYALDTLKADGIGIATSYGDKWPGDAAFAPIFDELNRRKAVVYFHPNGPFCCGGNLVSNVAPSWIEYPHDTSRAVLSLLFNGTLAKHRDIKFLFSHGGGTIPMLAGRIASSSGKSFKNLAQVAPNGVISEFQRLYYDTANATSAPTLSALTKLIPLQQITFGSDYPYYTEDDNISELSKFPFSASEFISIYRENALRLVPRLKA
jgi:predicted TIM-barrel fold metal-dependent hydrolase